MTPDELREKIALTLVLVADWQGHDKFSLVDTAEAADAVMLVLAEALAGKDAEIDLARAEIAELLAENKRLAGELAQLRERAVVLPEGWAKAVTVELMPWGQAATVGMLALIKSWRPSTGDTDATAERWRLDEREIDGGFVGTEYPRLWPPRRAALPEEHTDQTGDQT